MKRGVHRSRRSVRAAVSFGLAALLLTGCASPGASLAVPSPAPPLRTPEALPVYAMADTTPSPYPTAAGAPGSLTASAPAAGSLFEGPRGDFGWREGAVLAAIFAGFIPGLSGDDDAFETMGDTLQLTLPITAALSTAVYSDEDGAWMFAKQFGTAWGITYALKFTMEKTRPSGSNNNSYPSGHTMGAFSGAAFLERRYGWLFGVPAYTGAALVGLSRMDADAHFADDVLAGASIALMSSWYWTTPYSESVTVTPIASGDSVGLGIGIFGPRPAGRSSRRLEEPFEATGRYEFSMGSSWEPTNTVASPRDTGTPIDLSALDTASNPTVTAAATYTHYLTKSQELAIRLTPYEVQDVGNSPAPFSFDNQAFAAGTPTLVNYILYEIRARWRYDLNADGPWHLALGGGLAAQWTRVIFEQGPIRGAAEEWSVLPVAHAAGAYEFSDKLLGLLDFDIGGWEDVSTWDTVIGVRYALNPRWDIGLDYHYFVQDLTFTDLSNQLEQNRLMFTTGYSF